MPVPDTRDAAARAQEALIEAAGTALADDAFTLEAALAAAGWTEVQIGPPAAGQVAEVTLTVRLSSGEPRTLTLALAG